MKMSKSRTGKARRMVDHMQEILLRTTDPKERQELRRKIAGARRWLEALERNHVKRETAAAGAAGWWKQ